MMSAWVYALLRGAVYCYFRLFYPIRARGTENVPASGPCILCGNHQSMSDPLVVVCALKRSVSFMAKKELFDIWGLNWILRGGGVFPVDRAGGDLSAVRAAIDILSQGKALGIYPQGSREYKGKKPFQGGVSLIALRSGAPVIPVYTCDRARLFHPIRVTFGPPVDLSAFSGKVNSAALREATACVERAVYALKVP